MKGAFGAAVFSALAVKEAAATFGWGSDDPRALCDTEQQEGFDFLRNPGLVSKRELSGWIFSQMTQKSCDSIEWMKSWHGQSALQFDIKNEQDVELPFIGAYGKPFWVSELSLIAEHETELELKFKMPDNTICTQIVKCGPTPTTVHNDKCGGAVGLGFGFSAAGSAANNAGNSGINFGNLFSMGSIFGGSGEKGGSSICGIGIGHLGFDCAPPAGIPHHQWTPRWPLPIGDDWHTHWQWSQTWSWHEQEYTSWSSQWSTAWISAGSAITDVPASSDNLASLTVSASGSSAFVTQDTTITSCAPGVTDCPARSGTPHVTQT
ncbi:hypothetical protein KEM54_006327, partial [Ascosphaera aggregata]